MQRENEWRRILLLGLERKDLTQAPKNLLMEESPSIERGIGVSCDGLCVGVDYLFNFPFWFSFNDVRWRSFIIWSMRRCLFVLS